MSDVKLVKINNAMFIANIAPMVQEFVKRIDLPNVSYEGMVYVLQTRAQYGGNASEVWIAHEDEGYLGWASWHVCEAPLVATVYMDYIYSKSNRRDVALLFAKQFMQFADERNAIWLTMDIVKSGKLLEHFKNMAKDLGLEMSINPWFPCLATKVDFYKEKLKE